MTNYKSSRLNRVHHMLFCASQLCDTNSETRALFARLVEPLGILVRYDIPPSQSESRVACLGGCLGGPVITIYPDGEWHHHVDKKRLEQIIKRHVKDDLQNDRWIFHLLDRPDRISDLNELAAD